MNEDLEVGAHILSALAGVSAILFVVLAVAVLL